MFEGMLRTTKYGKIKNKPPPTRTSLNAAQEDDYRKYGAIERLLKILIQKCKNISILKVKTL